MDEVEAAWLAGLLEGEAWFGWTTLLKGRRHRYPEIRVSMTDKDIIERVAKLFVRSVVRIKSGKYNKSRGYKQQWIAAVTGTKTIPILESILPFLGKRRGKRVRDMLKKGASWAQF